MANYKDIYLKRYNNGDRNFSAERTVFNQMEMEELFGEEETEKIYHKLCVAAKLVVPDATDITRITINLDDLAYDIGKLRDEILKHAESVSGDDDVYDYFPDIIYAFAQIFEQLNELLEEGYSSRIYNELMDKLIAEHPNTIGDDGVIPFWND